MYSLFVPFLIWNWGFSVVASEVNDTCMTSTGRSGRCVLVKDCQYALNIVRNDDRSAEDLQFVEENKCGTLPGRHPLPLPLICCPVVQNVERCGKAKIVSRIFGGSETEAGTYPWAGVIEYRTPRGKLEVQCGCALVHHRWVLTAAHCLVGVPRRLTVRAVRFNEWNSKKKANCTIKDDVKLCRAVYEIEEQFPHPKYSINNPNMRHDIGLLKTKVNVEFNDYVIPMCMPFKRSIQELNIAEEHFVVTGWGQTDQDTPGRQRDVTLKGRSNAVCDVVFKPQKIKLEADQLCIGGEKGQDSCRGDSGGPLMYEDKLSTYIVGIVSFGAYECGTAGHPGVYTKVSDFLEWIEEVMIENGI